eukprot:Skav201312  [mRNA]  locus=scaffold1490:109079:114118:- [translate_table: standard]
MSLTGGIQGGELDGHSGILRVAPDKLKNFIAISMCLLGSEVWREFAVRHWTGKAAFVAAFRRPLFSVLDKVFETIMRLTREDSAPQGAELDEIMSFMVLSIQGEAVEDQVKVRQDNKMAKRSLKGLEHTHENGGFAGLEHPWGAYLWFTPEAEKIQALPGWWMATWSQCCYGGRRTKWTSLLTNSRRAYEALNRPECNCTHQEPYAAWADRDGQVHFDTHEEAEYPWLMCRRYGDAIAADLLSLTVSPVGTARMDLNHMLYTQILGAARGLQSEDLVYKLIQQIVDILGGMEHGQEEKHLAFLARQVGLKGTDVRLVIPREMADEREVMVPYPAFRWFWRTMMSWKWTTPQHINVLEMTSILAELRRRSRSVKYFRQRPHQQQASLRMAPKLHLKFKGITPKTAAIYRREVHRFLLYAELERGTLPNSTTELDECMGEFINELYQEGESVSHAGWLLSGFKRFLPSIRRDLMTAQQYYNNWLRDHVPVRAVPMPWDILKTLAAVAYERGHVDLAVLLLLGFIFFLRTMEIVQLSTEDVHFDHRSGSIVVTLANTKTSRKAHQTLVVQNSALATLLAPLLAQLPTGKIWRFQPRGLRLCFQALVSHINAETCQFSVYSIRRGGATHAYVASRSLDYVSVQGRWKDVRTARIYLDDARAALLRMLSDDGAIEFCSGVAESSLKSVNLARPHLPLGDWKVFSLGSSAIEHSRVLTLQLEESASEMGLTADSMSDFLDQGAAETQDRENCRTGENSKEKE